jgi:hypothetical protein
MAIIINLTPHAINETLTGKTYQTSGIIARVSQTLSDTGMTIDGVPLFHRKFGDVTDLPDARDGVYLIVSAMVADAVPHRHDLISPGDLVRDDKGQPIGCKGFITRH